MLPTALVPVRIARSAKRRLAHVLSPDERFALMQRSFDHVTGVLVDAGLRVVAISPTALDVGDGVEVRLDGGAGLNQAIGSACEDIGTPVFVVHADLPWLTVADVDHALSVEADIVICRSDDGGTNGLLMRRMMPLAFGPASALRHAGIAHGLGYRTHVLDSTGWSTDVDDERALTATSASPPRGR